MRRWIVAGTVGAVALLVGSLLVRGGTPPAQAADTLSPEKPTFSYDAGPYTNLNVGGLLVGSCDVPEGCDNHQFSVSIPAGYYEGLRAQGKVGVVQIAVSWQGNDNDFDLALLNDKGDPIATSGFGNSDFERINFTELPSGTYTVQTAIFRAANVGFHADIRLLSQTPAPTAAAAGDGGVTFSNGTPATLERSSGEPNLETAPNGEVWGDIPLGAGTNSLFFKSTDNGDTFRPLAPYHPNNNPLLTNVAGGGDSGTSFQPDGRVCISELNTLVSLGIGCSSDGGKTFAVANPLVIDPSTPLVDRQWQVATPQGEQFITAQFGILTVGSSKPGMRLYKEVAASVFEKVADIETGKSMKSYTLAVDPSDTDANGGTIVEAYLRSNEGADKAANPHELMVWQSTDGGKTITVHRVAALPTTPGNNFASVAVDRQGDTYVAWSEQGTWDIFYSVARKGDLDHWSAPVRVNIEPATTAIQPTIKVGDRGRVFLGYYGAEQIGNPDALTNGVWNAYLATSTNGACQLDATPCTRPTFHQARVTEHPVQFRGICLGGTGCGGDPYYGDRSMLEYLDIAFSPATGQAHLIVTDSSRTNRGTTVTHYRQLSGPSAYADKPDIAGVTHVGDHVDDPNNDAEWPYLSPTPASPAPGADITSTQLSYPNPDTLRVTMKLADASAMAQALQAGVGQELMIATRFATDLDVFWIGLKTSGAAPTFAAGHLEPGIVVDKYTTDDTIPVAGKVEGDTVTMDVPVAKLTTTLEQPETVESAAPVVQAVKGGQQLFAVTGFSFVGVTAADDEVAKHLLDVTPAFTFTGAPAGGGGTPSGAPAGAGQLPATGGTDTTPLALAALAGAAVLGTRWRRRRA